VVRSADLGSESGDVEAGAASVYGQEVFDLEEEVAGALG